MFIKFVIQNQLFSYSLKEFSQILDIPCEGACVWSLDELAYGVPMDGTYETNPPSPDYIISSIRIDLEGQVTLIRHEEEIDVHDHQILTREIVPTLKPLEEIIRENIFCQGRKTRKDRGMRRGRHSTSSSSAFDQPSSSHLNDNDDGNDEGTSRASTPSPIRYVNSISDVSSRPSNPQPLQSHPSLDITLSLSPVTPLDHILDTPSPSPPQPQPPIMGHPLYYNYHDYHESTCICCSHNRTLFLTLRDEMNIMFAHLEYLLTTAITSHFPPPP
ncbi:hypothetical protein Tco_0794177 [Tanacetum coccineum]